MAAPSSHPSLLPTGDDQTDRYQVALPQFFGPMDLLLSLIEQEELEITVISLARVTDQYLAYVTQLQKIDLDNITDFLVIASKLILIKSEVLLPRPPPSIIELDDDAEIDDLVQQLRDYKRFKDLAGDLRQIEQTGRRSFLRLAAPPKIESKPIPGSMSVDKLLAAVRRALAVKPEALHVDTVVPPQLVTIGQQIGLIRRRLNDAQTLRFADLLDASASRVEVIVTFLALLELAKRRYLDLEQEQNFSEIHVKRVAEATTAGINWDELGSMTELS